MRGLLGLLLLAVAASAVPVQDGVQGDGVDPDHPEEVPGLFEGDIDLLPGENPLHRNAIGDKRRRWANGIVPYEIESNYPSVVQQIFRDAMHEIEEKTKVNGKKCIQFRPHQGEAGYVKFSHGSGCHTPVGFIHRKSAVTIGHGCERKGTVMHELLHALGFWHEQSRADRDNYVTIHLDNVQKGHEGNFNKYPIGYIDELGQPYDYGSIMHYSAYAFAIDRSKMTIEPKQRGVVIGQRVALSPTDIKEIQILYDCIPRPSGSGNGGSGSFVTSAPVTIKPVSGADLCTFQNGLCTWTQNHGDTTDWRVQHGATSSSRTGPSGDHYGSKSANYIYVEASGHSRQVAKLDSKEYPGGHYCLSFFYHMYGSNMGTLKLNAVFFSHGHQFSSHTLKTWSGDHGDSWQQINMNLNIQTNAQWKIEFEADIGTGYRSDMAIDDIQVYPGTCQRTG